MNQHQLAVAASKKEAGNKQKERTVGKEERKLLAAMTLKRSFKVNFDSMFLDMLLPTDRVVKIDPPREENPRGTEPPKVRTEVGERAPAPHAPEPPKEQPQARPAETQPRKKSGSEAKEASRPERTTEKHGKESGKVDRKEPVREEKRAEKKKEKNAAGEGAVQNTLAEVRIVKYELHARFEKALSKEQRDALKKKIQKILEDDSLTAKEFIAQAAIVIRELAAALKDNNVEIQESLSVVTAESFGNDLDLLALLQEGDAEALSRRKRFLKRFLKNLRDALETAKENLSADESGAETREAPEKAADEAFLKLVKRNPGRNSHAKVVAQEAGSGMEQVTNQILKPLLEAMELVSKSDESGGDSETTIKERKSSGPGLQNRQQRIRTATQPQVQALAEELVKAEGRTRGRGRHHGGGRTVTRSVEIEEASKGGGAGKEAPWQNSYGQNSSLKGLDLPRRARKAQAPPRPAPRQVLEQIVQNAKIVVKGGKGEATIRLQPEFLGKVELKVVVENGKATVRMTAENPSVRQIIADNVQDLRRNLTELGLEIETVIVTTGGGFTESGAGEEGNESGKRQHGRAGIEGLNLDLEEEEDGERIGPRMDGSTVRYVA
ncbi:MAG: flagellar hook-length control protein FliK [Candidatus Hydrogenedentota bacterium]|nr:MAG: flagellar hook-length control protein FliK [Candidatus Hydrogenedentota bacterium]